MLIKSLDDLRIRGGALTGVVQAVHALPAGQSGGLGLSLQGGVLRKGPGSRRALRALLWGVVTGEGEG